MTFNDYIIDEEDFKFFMSLSAQEKLLFLHDLICDEVYGTGSISEDETPDLEEFFAEESYDTKLQRLIANTINVNIPINILLIGDKLVFNSDIPMRIESYVASMFEKGMFLIHRPMTKRELGIFQQQEYCKVYTLLGQSTISLS